MCSICYMVLSSTYSNLKKQNVIEQRAIRKIDTKIVIISPCYHRRYHDLYKHHARLYSVQTTVNICEKTLLSVRNN